MNDFYPSDELIAHVKEAEGYVRVPAPDPVGLLTCGYGHRCWPGSNPPAEVSPELADTMLRSDLMVAGGLVRQCVTVPLDQDQYDALTDFVFNLGGQAFKDSTMLRCINAGDWNEACEQIMRWNHAGGQVMRGLTLRRAWEQVRLRPKQIDATPQPITPTVVATAPLEAPTVAYHLSGTITEVDS
jgi:GH24 family phage-related lysozyme (muramidase)